MDRLKLLFLTLEITLMTSVVVSSLLISLPIYTIGVGFFLAIVIVHLEVALQESQRLAGSLLLLDIGCMFEQPTLNIPAGYKFDGKDF